jgi:hypothetical protein
MHMNTKPMKKNRISAATGLVTLGACLFGGACGDETITLPERLFETVTATAMECADGGQTILTGIDANRNGTLDTDEIQAREPVCAGADGAQGDDGIAGTNALIRTTDELPGGNCVDGGVRIDVGTDGNTNDVLDEGEIELTSYACDGPEGAPGLTSAVRLRDNPGVLCEAGGVVVDSGIDTNGNGTLDDEEVLQSNAVCEGIPGRSGLVTITPEPAGANCIQGGQRIDSGVDQSADGILDANEITQTEYICDTLANLVTVSPEPAATSVNCPNVGGARVETGIDDNGNGVLDPAEVDTSNFVCNQGTGERSLVLVTPEPLGQNCPEGGQRIDTGIDDNDDGVLDPGEIDLSNYVCNSPDGADGVAGGNAVRVQPEPAGVNCPNGGLAIQTGPDTNDNQALDDAEVTSTTYSCDGLGTQALVTTSAEPAGMNCPNGGTRIDSGLDANGNGTLDPGELGTPQFICNTVPSTTVPFFIATETLGPFFNTDPFEADITAVGGGGGGYTWAVVAGALPQGVTIEPTGTPSTVISGPAGVPLGTYTFTLRVTDFSGLTAEFAYTLDITPPPCEPGQNGLAGSTGVPTEISAIIPGFVDVIAADTSSTGFVYIMGDSSFAAPDQLERYNKVTGASQNLVGQGGITTADTGWEIDIAGSNIYIVNDDSGTTANRIQRISNDGGATFSKQDMAILPAGTADIRGIEEYGNALFAITHEANPTIFEISLAGALPAVAVPVASLPGFVDCYGLAMDDDYFYTMCQVGPGGISGNVVRLSRMGGQFDVLLADGGFGSPTEFFLNVDGNGLGVHDVDGDGKAEALFVKGGYSENDYYFCVPGGNLPLFTRRLVPNPGAGNFGLESGLAVDPVNAAIWFYEWSPDEIYRLD